MNKDVRALKYDFLKLAGRMQAKITALARKWLLTKFHNSAYKIINIIM